MNSSRQFSNSKTSGATYTSGSAQQKIIANQTLQTKNYQQMMIDQASRAKEKELSPRTKAALKNQHFLNSTTVKFYDATNEIGQH